MDAAPVGKGCRVVFRIGDIFVPEAAEVLDRLGQETRVEGRVVGLSDRGADKDYFAIVQIEGLKERVIIPIDKIIDA